MNQKSIFVPISIMLACVLVMTACVLLLVAKSPTKTPQYELPLSTATITTIYANQAKKDTENIQKLLSSP